MCCRAMQYINPNYGPSRCVEMGMGVGMGGWVCRGSVCCSGVQCVAECK